MNANQLSDAKQGLLNPVQLFWLCFVSTNIAKHIAECTNKRMHKRQREHPESKTYKYWKDVSYITLSIVVVIGTQTGFTKKTSLSAHFDEKRGTNHIKEAIQRLPFLLILRHLCVYDCERDIQSYHAEDRRDNGWKGRIIWDKWNQYASRFWIIDDWLSCDEYMIDSFSKWVSKVRIKAKKHGTGIKIIKICNKYGFVFFCHMNCKYFLFDVNQTCPGNDMTIGSKIMLFFVKKYKNHLSKKILVFDNYFGGYCAQLEALKYQTPTLCTLRKNCKFIPHKLLKSRRGHKLQNHEFNVMVNQNDPFIAHKIKDGTKLFTLGHTLPLNVVGIQETKRVEDHIKLKANTFYNEYMGGVDLSNKFCLNGSVNSKMRGWTGHNIRGFIDHIWSQCIAIFKQSTGSKYQYKMTKEKLCNLTFDHGLPAMSKLYNTNFNKNWRYKETVHPRLTPQDIRCIKKEWSSLRTNKAERKKLQLQREAKRSKRDRVHNQNQENVNNLNVLQRLNDSSSDNEYHEEEEKESEFEGTLN